jgi:transcriptional regulator with XRE-family HTH domain
LALRRARDGGGLSQSEVADRLGWSLSKIQRIELGDVAVSVTDLRALTDLYGGFPADVVENLVRATRVARRNRWLTKPEYREHLTAATIELMGFEAAAASIRTFQPTVLPGVLQTPAVAETILRFRAEDQEGVRVRRDVRMLRSEQILERADAPAYHLVLDEAVLSRDVGGTRLAAEQMAMLEKYAQYPHVHIRILPMARGALFGLDGGFTLIELNADDPDDVVLYREGWNGDVIIDDPDTVRVHRKNFEDTWVAAWDRDASLNAIRARAAALRSEMDRSVN